MKTRAAARVAKNPEFIKISGEIKKAKARGKTIKLAESLKESKERKDENDSKKTWGKDEKLAEYLKRAEIQEALNIAADLYAVQNKVSLNKVVIPPPPPATKVAAVSSKKGVDPVTSTAKEAAPESDVKGSITIRGTVSLTAYKTQLKNARHRLNEAPRRRILQMVQPLS